MTKRLLDLFGSLVGLILLSPVLAFIAIWVKLDSKGPILFRQERVGRYNLPFRIHKFRTMVIDAETRGLQLTTGRDPRITRSGQFLRKYKLDELAQLIDVLKGDMSLVGPRPEVPKYVAHYPADLKEVALSVKPGITDFASIEYRDENEILSRAADPERAYIEQVLPAKLKYHKKYATEQSALLDLRLILKTAMLVFGRWVPDKLHVLGKLTRHQKRLVMLAFDAIALPFAYWSALVLIEETFSPRVTQIWWLFFVIPLTAIPIFIHLGLYRAVIRYMEDKSAFTILFGASLSVLVLQIIVPLASLPVHKTAWVIYWLVALVYIGGSRILARHFYRKSQYVNAFNERVLIYGAGEAGVKLALGLQAASKKIPVAFIDDDQRLQNHDIGGIKVYPPTYLPQLISHIHIDRILIAIPSAPYERLKEIIANLQELHQNISIVPSADEFINRVSRNYEVLRSRSYNEVF
jgi:lipopolysaccharide/colanic/teichoic acid biosynthesis glycosyltransferase